MFSKDDNPWKTRQTVARGVLLWRTLDLVMDWIVYSHYQLRRREASIRPATSQVLNDALRYAKGFAGSCGRWLMSTYPHDRVPAFMPQPSEDEPNGTSAGHANASPCEHAE